MNSVPQYPVLLDHRIDLYSRHRRRIRDFHSASFLDDARVLSQRVVNNSSFALLQILAYSGISHSAEVADSRGLANVRAICAAIAPA
jgi:hypothetical protein